MAADLSLVIRAVDNASGVLDHVEKRAGSLGKTAGTVLRVGMLGAAAGIGAAVFAAIDFIKKAAEEEESISRLAAAVDANSGSWVAQGEAIEKAIKARQRLAFDDEELRTSLALLVAQTGNVDEAMRRQAVAMDLARGAGIDLTSASRLLGKVTDESHAALSRLGIVIDKDADAAEVLAAVQQRFGGQAATFADTATGKWARLGIAFENVKETIGSALLPMVIKLADKLTLFVEEHEEDIQRISEAFARWAEETIPQVVNGLLSLARAARPFLQALEPIAKWFATNKTAITAAVIAIGAVVTVMFAAWAISATTAAIATIAAAAPILGLIAVVALLAAGIYILVTNFDDVKAKVMDIISGFMDWLKDHWQQIVVTAIGILFPPAGGMYLLVTNFDKVKSMVLDVVSSVAGALAPHWQQIVTVALAILFPPGAGLFAIVTNTFGIRDAVIGVLQDIVNQLAAIFAPVGNIIAEPFAQGRRVIQRVVDVIWNLIEAINSIPSPNLPNLPSLPNISPFQHGGQVMRRGLQLLGERGPEIAALPVGTHVFNATQTQAMLSGGGGGSVAINIYPLPHQDARDIATEVDRIISDRRRRGR